MNSLTFFVCALLLVSLTVEGLNITVTTNALHCTTPSGNNTNTFIANDWSIDTLNDLNKVVFNDLLLTKELDGCSAALSRSMSNSLHHRGVTLSQYDDSGTEVIKIQMSDVIVTSWRSSSSTVEKVALKYFKIQYEAFGSRFCFDIRKNQNC
jgi:type VI protein secretion system component Hcp